MTINALHFHPSPFPASLGLSGPMTVADKIDTVFLKNTVADVVVKACSACAVARPDDPIGFVAGWLDQFVENDAILKKRALELAAKAVEDKAETEVGHPETTGTRGSTSECLYTLRPFASRLRMHIRASRGNPVAPRFGISPRFFSHSGERISVVSTRFLVVFAHYLTTPLPLSAPKQARTEAVAAVADHATRVEQALAHLATLSGDPDDLYTNAANYMLKLSSRGGDGMRAYVADMEEREEDEMAEKEEGDEGEESEPEPEEEETDDDDSKPEPPGEPDYQKFFFRYVAVAAPKGDDQDFLVGKKLERGTGVSFALVDKTPKQPWIDVPNVMMYRGAPLEPKEGDEPLDPEAPPVPTTVHFVSGFPRSGSYFAVPITLSSGEVAGMLCIDTVKTPGGGNGRTVAEEDKDLARAVAKAAAKAMDAAAAARRAMLAEAKAEQASIAEAIAAAEAPEEGEAGEDKTEGDAEAEPEAEEEAPPEPEEGVEQTDKELIASLTFKMNASTKRLTLAETDLEKKRKLLTAVSHLIDTVDEESLGELRSVPRAPKATWKVVKAGLYACGVKKFNFESWSLTRKLLTGEYSTNLKALDPLDVGKRDPKAWEGVHKCLDGLKDKQVVKESKVGARLFKWIEGIVNVSDAALEVSDLKAAFEDFENEIEKAQERIAEAAADAEAAAEAEAAAAEAGGAEAEGEAAEAPAE